MEPIKTPGIYPGIPPEIYHDGAFPGTVSYSTLKILLDDAGPAKYRAAIDGPRVDKPAFDNGTVAHALILGEGADRIRVLDGYTSYRTKDAQQARDDAYANGYTPILPDKYQAISTTVEAIPDHIHAWFTGGTAEVAFRWAHPLGTDVRGQIDYLRDDAIVDLKTIRATDTRTLERQIFDLRYYLQAATYQAAYEALTGTRLPYYIVAVDLENPHLARVVEISDHYLELGRAHLDEAITTYQECTASGEWPAYSPEPAVVNPPPWAVNELENRAANDTINALETYLGEFK